MYSNSGVGHSLRQFIRERKKELRTAAIFLVLIFLPSGLLGYLSWHAVENEKLLSRQKIIASYRQFVQLAARDIDQELENVQAGLQVSVEEVLGRAGTESVVEQIDSLNKVEPLILSCTLLVGPGQVAYPVDLTLKRKTLFGETEDSEKTADEYDLYKDLASRGEELEYRNHDYEGAVSTYTQLLTETSSPQLHAMAYTLIGRAETKMDDWDGALKTYEKLLHSHPEERDFNKMYLRFLAQYQIAVCLDNLHRPQEAVARLLGMNDDLLDRSDTLNRLQYFRFQDWIATLGDKLLAKPEVQNAASLQQKFQRLATHEKKPISDKYFVRLFDEELRELIVERKHYRPIIRYFSGQADEAPFLLGYLTIPDQSGTHISGLLGFRVNLARLRDRILPALLRHLRTGETVVLAIMDDNGNYVIGTTEPRVAPVAMQTLDAPFKFWQLGIFLTNEEPTSPLRDFRSILWLWLISLLLLSIFSGAYIFIRHARQEAQLSELKSTFVSRVSHELRTPITSIKMLAEHLEMQLRQAVTAREEDFRQRTGQYLGVISRESDRLGRLIENILDFSKIERGVKQYTFEYEIPAVVLQKAIDSFQPHAEARGFALSAEIDDTLPELLLDSDAITQALINMFSNAVKYSAEDKTIIVRAFRDKNEVCMEVEDHGIGIPPAQLSNIFDEFYRVDQKLNSNRQAGMGLGLTLIRHIVQAHGGTIQVRSEAGKGSTFMMRLPIQPDLSLNGDKIAGKISSEKVASTSQKQGLRTSS